MNITKITTRAKINVNAECGSEEKYMPVIEGESLLFNGKEPFHNMPLPQPKPRQDNSRQDRPPHRRYRPRNLRHRPVDISNNRYARNYMKPSNDLPFSSCLHNQSLCYLLRRLQPMFILAQYRIILALALTLTLIYPRSRSHTHSSLSSLSHSL